MHPILTLSSIDGHDLVNVVVQIVVVGLIFWLLWWFVNWVGIPQPFLKVIQVILGLAAVVFLINVLLGLNGHGFIVWSH